jgi:hypothetical protein
MKSEFLCLYRLNENPNFERRDLSHRHVPSHLPGVDPGTSSHIFPNTLCCHSGSELCSYPVDSSRENRFFTLLSQWQIR